MLNPYHALKNYKQFILWTLTPDGKKLPCNPLGNVSDAHNSANWLTFDHAQATAALLGGSYGVAFVFTANDPFFVVDIDKCLLPSGEWSPLAMELITALAGSLVEVSQSGRGLHLIGSGVVPPHAKKNTALGIELYSELRFLALGNMDTATGDCAYDCTHYLPSLVSRYFPPSLASEVEWTDGPCEEWNGIEDDEELLESAMRSRSAAATFGGAVTFSDLWHADEGILAKFYPNQQGNFAYDRSSADAALAQMLAFWTGKDCERMSRLMRQSGLVRDKWEREDYLPRTILRACGLQGAVYGQRAEVNLPEGVPLASLRGSDAEVAYAENIRAQMLSRPLDHDTAVILAQQESAKLWINNREAQPEEVARMVTPAPLIDTVKAPTIKTGLQYLGASQQIELFQGCTYIIPQHKVLTPNGAMLKPEQFNATYGGYIFQLDDSGEKTTKKAWEAFTESQLVSYPMAWGTWFRPDQPSGALIEHEGFTFVNIYTPVNTTRVKGDITPFMNHLKLLLPDERDRNILLSYMAACVQYKGKKFQWTPLIQGAEGNGKTLLTRCVSYAIGERFTHFPPANEISEKFNEWLFGKLFIGIEDIYVPDHKKEVIETLKPMITNDRLAKRAMQQSQVTDDNYANFMLNSNHRDAIRKTENDRRFCIFYTAQQSHADIIRDGMAGNYFTRLYDWLKKESGYAIVNEFLHTFEITEEFNPAGSCQRAPVTSSTNEALSHSVGSIEHVIQEAIDEGTLGMMGGFISSVALDRVLKAARLERYAPVNKRKAILEGIGYILHPALHDGRLSIASVVDDNKKPRLYVQKDHPSLALTCTGEISKKYLTAQTCGIGENLA